MTIIRRISLFTINVVGVVVIVVCARFLHTAKENIQLHGVCVCVSVCVYFHGWLSRLISMCMYL